MDEYLMKTVARIALFSGRSFLNRTKVKVKLLYAGDRSTVLGRRAKDPGLEGTDHTGFNAVTNGAQNRKIGNFAAGVNGHIDHHVALYPMGQY
jgi:hypothetical protein